MKSYDETARTVLDRVHAYERAQVRRRTAMVRGAVTLCCLGIVFGLGFLFLRHGDGFRPQHVISGTDTSHTDPTDNTENTTNIHITTDSDHTDTNVTDTGIGSTDTGTNSTDSPPLTFPFEGSHYVSAFPTGELPVTGSSNLFIGGGADGPGEVGDVQKRFPEAIVYYDDPDVLDFFSRKKLYGLESLSKKDHILLPLNGINFSLWYQNTKTTFLYDNPYESLRKYGESDYYRGVWEGEQVDVYINRNTGILESLRIKMKNHMEYGIGDVSEDQAREIAEQILVQLYGENVFSSFSFDTIRGGIAPSGYQVVFCRKFEAYHTEEKIMISVAKNGFVFEVKTQGIGHFVNIDSTLTLDRVKAAENAIRLALPDWDDAMEIVRGGSGEYYLKFHYKANLYWLSIP